EKMLARTKQLTIFQKKSGYSSSIIRPERDPRITNAPRNRAVPESPGNTNVHVGINQPPLDALFADSAATTPSYAPFPEGRLGFFTVLLAWSYAINEAISAPAPGNAPINTPVAELRRVSGRCFLINAQLGMILS